MSLSERLARARSGSPPEPAETGAPTADDILPVWRPLEEPHGAPGPMPVTTAAETATYESDQAFELGPVTAPEPPIDPGILGDFGDSEPGSPGPSPLDDDLDSFGGLPPLLGRHGAAGPAALPPDETTSASIEQSETYFAVPAVPAAAAASGDPIDVEAGTDPLAEPIRPQTASVLDRSIHDVLADLAPPPVRPTGEPPRSSLAEMSQVEEGPAATTTSFDLAFLGGVDPASDGAATVPVHSFEDAELDDTSWITTGHPETARPEPATPPALLPARQPRPRHTAVPQPVRAAGEYPLFGRLAQFDTLPDAHEMPASARDRGGPPAAEAPPHEAPPTGRARDAFPPLDLSEPLSPRGRQENGEPGLVLVERNDPELDEYYASLYLGGESTAPTDAVDVAKRKGRAPKWLRWAERMTGRKDKHEATSEHVCPACGGPASIDIMDRARGIRHMSCDSCFKMWQERLPATP